MLCIVATCASAAASLKGSRPSQERQGEEAYASDLSYIENDAALERMKRAGYLVPIPVGKSLVVDERLEPKWHFIRPWTAKFLAEISSDFYAKFGRPLQVNSAVRTLERQKELRRSNGNAAALHGKRRSSHPTGAAIDLAKIGYSTEELKWVAERLLSLEKAGMIEATSERRQAVFHIMVFKKYGGKPKKKK
jgi:hypothetical protein